MPMHKPAHSRVSGNPEPRTGSPPSARSRASSTRYARGRTESKTRAEEALAAAEQRRLAPVLREAHARLGLWRTCDDKTCRRTQSCGGEADPQFIEFAASPWLPTALHADTRT
jgi:hypothetical protein